MISYSLLLHSTQGRFCISKDTIHHLVQLVYLSHVAPCGLRIVSQRTQVILTTSLPVLREKTLLRKGAIPT